MRWQQRRALVAATAAMVVAVSTGCTGTGAHPTPSESTSIDLSTYVAGAEGIGGKYYPKAGNGGYDVGNYDLDVTYEPDGKRLSGIATITAKATENLLSFNLDFTGLDTDSVTVNDAEAKSDQHDDGELVITPANGI